MKKKISNGLILLVLIGLALFAFRDLFPFTIYETPIFCNGYSWISCVAKDVVNSPISQEIEGWSIFNTNPTKGACLHYQCRIHGFASQGYDPNCVRLVVGNQKYSLSSLPVTIARNQQFYFDAGNPICYITNQIAGTYFYVPINEVLLWTGSSGSTVGTPVQGADGCTFNPGQHDKILKLFNQNEQELQTSQLYTVPTGTAYSYVDSEKRHVCGYAEEACSLDSDCTGHPLTVDNPGDAECSNGYLNRYGCRQYGTAPCIEWASDAKLLCLEYGTPLSRCEVVERIPVQCCPYADTCGEGVCNPDTYTCEQPQEVECTQDWECGQAQQCDRTLKQVLKNVCVNNTCAKEVLYNVACCYDADCPLGYYCSNDKQSCLESTIPKSECPYACCENEAEYFDKPPPNGMVCCPDHSLADSLDDCGTTPGPDPDLDENQCLAKEGDGIFVLGYTWVEEGGFIGLFPVGKCVPVYNWPLVGLLLGALVFVVLFLYVLKKPRSRGKKRRK